METYLTRNRRREILKFNVMQSYDYFFSACVIFFGTVLTWICVEGGKVLNPISYELHVEYFKELLRSKK